MFVEVEDEKSGMVTVNTDHVVLLKPYGDTHFNVFLVQGEMLRVTRADADRIFISGNKKFS